jgi:hypothetical protein
MFDYPLKPQKNTLPMFSLRPKKPPNSSSEFSTSSNRSMRFCRNPMISTSSAMIKIGYHTSFKWDTRSSYICKKSVLQSPIESSAHFTMGLTLSPRPWVSILLRSTLHPLVHLGQILMERSTQFPLYIVGRMKNNGPPQTSFHMTLLSRQHIFHLYCGVSCKHLSSQI